MTEAVAIWTIVVEIKSQQKDSDRKKVVNKS